MTDATIIQLLTSGCILAFGAVISLSCWIAVRAFKEQDTDRKLNDQRHKENQAATAQQHAEIMKRLEGSRERAEARYMELNATQEAQFRQFGLQLHGVQELLIKEIHKMDLRLTRLEVWAEGYGLPRKFVPGDHTRTGGE